MEVGIEDCLHIEFEYNKSKYHLKDVIVGKIYFLLVRIKIKHMEIAIIKRETTGAGELWRLETVSPSINNFLFFLGSNVFTENETIAKYEIMDGAPVKGESIPIRVFLAGYDLTPTMRDINKKFSVRYFLNLVLMDTEDRRYFKQQEITLWRKSEKSRKSLSNSGSGAVGGGGSSSNLTMAQQNAQMPTHLVQGTSAIHPPMLESIGGPLSSQTSPGVAQTDQSHMGLFTEEDSPQHEATGSKVRSNPLAFDTDEDKTPSKEEELPVPVSSKEPPKKQQSSGESSSLFEFSNDGAANEPPSPTSTAVTNSNNDEAAPTTSAESEVTSSAADDGN